MIDLVERQIEEFIEKRRPPEEIRSELDIGFSYQNYTIEIFEIRPQWDDQSVIRHHPVVKAKFVKSVNAWKIYWMPSSLKWKAYEPQPQVTEVNKFLEIVEKDAFGCFFG